MLTLYALTDQYAELLKLADNAEDDADERAFMDTLEAIQGEIGDKLENLASVVKSIDANAEAIQVEAMRLSRRRTALLNARERLKTYMQDCMTAAGIDKHKGTRFTVSVADNPVSVAIDDEAAIPEEFMRVKREPDKSTIAGTLKDGGAVPGCRLERTRGLRIR